MSTLPGPTPVSDVAAFCDFAESSVPATGAESYEAERLQQLGSFAVLDTAPEKAFDDLTALAADVCAAPIALLALVDADRQWFKSRHGLTLTQIPRNDAFCVHAPCNRGIVMVSDAPGNHGFANHPLLAACPDLRLYARAPLVTTDGFVLGALCVLDTAPRALTEQAQNHLMNLAGQVISQLELRRRNRVLTSVLEERSAALATLRAKQRVLDGVLDHTDVLVYAKDLDGRFMLANSALGRAAQPGGGALIGRTDHDVFSGQVADRYRRHDLHIIATRQWEVFIEDLVHSDGSTHTYRSTKFPLVDDASTVIGVGGVSTDVTELVAARAAHAQAEQRWRALLEQSMVAVVVVGADGLIAYANPRAAALCGVQSATEIENRPAISLAAPGTEESLQELMQAILAGGSPLHAQQWRLQQVSGAQIMVEFNATGIDYLGVAAVQVEFRDITAAATAHAALQRIASTDPLTSLLNRRAFDAAVVALLDGGVCLPLSIALLDLDNFKVYNDSHGHSAGDVLLRNFATAARTVLRKDDVFARWGGDEFIVALPSTGSDQAAHVFERLRSCVPDAQTCSIGFTTWRSSEPLEAAVTRADHALYQAKNHGRDRVARA